MITPAREFGYPEAVAALHDALAFGTNPSLATITALAERLDSPQEAFRSIQVAGTNGKSSVARILAAILASHGVRVGLYTSPHLLHYRERIEVDGEMLAPDTFAWSVHNALKTDQELRDLDPAYQQATEFELLTAAALFAFRENKVDVAIFEVGMGGRWDATSVVDPEVAVITGVALDHTDHLGSTRDAIASDKAHVISPSTRSVLLGPGVGGVEPAFLSRLSPGQELVAVQDASGEPLAIPRPAIRSFEVVSRPSIPDGEVLVRFATGKATAEELRLPLPAYQAANAVTAYHAAALTLGDTLEHSVLSKALDKISLPGRFHVAQTDPWLVLDVAHNPDAAAVLAGAIRDAWPVEEERPMLAISVFGDKDVEGMLRVLDKVVFEFAVIDIDHPRARPAFEVAEIIWNITGEQPVVAPTAEDMILYARGTQTDLVITGGHAVVGDALMTLRQEP